MGTHVTELLGGERVLGSSVQSNLDLARATREGLPAAAAMQVADLLSCYNPALELEIRAALRHNADQGGSLPRLTPGESDIVVRMAGTLARAIDTLGDRKKAVHWLTTSNPALGGEIPAQLFDTSAGTDEVEAILERIEFGVYS